VLWGFFVVLCWGGFCGGWFWCVTRARSQISRCGGRKHRVNRHHAGPPGDPGSVRSPSCLNVATPNKVKLSLERGGKKERTGGHHTFQVGGRVRVMTASARRPSHGTDADKGNKVSNGRGKKEIKWESNRFSLSCCCVWNHPRYIPWPGV